MVKEKLNRDDFIKSNLGLVHSICKRFIGKGIEYDDLYQAGCIGLIKATDGFDENRGIMFSTYAVPVIMGEVKRLFRDGGAVKVSRSVKELSMKISYVKQKLEQSLCREPTILELAEKIGVSPEEITEAICATQATVSLTYSSDEGIKEAELPTESYEEEISNKILIGEALNKLNETERKIMKYRYFESMTQSKTAKILNMTQVQISRAEKKILLKMREMIR